MSHKEEILTPVGRLVQGSLYEPQTTDPEGRPLVTKTGANAEQPRVNFYFGLAIPKGNETHWSQTEWGTKIYKIGQAGFPQGQFQHPSFAWKITDGDSQIPNKAGRRPCDKEGYPGHWVLNFSSGFAPSIHNANGTKQILEINAVNLGDYIQVYGTVADNGSMQQPGVYLNHSMVALAGYGNRIILGADPKSVGFGNASLPPGASQTPIGQGFNPSPAIAPLVSGMASNIAPIAPLTAPPVMPYPQILTPPVPVATIAPVKNMTPLAAGNSYEAMIAAGWTDAQLIQHGYMTP